MGTFYVRYNNNAATDKGIAYNLEIRLLDEENSVQFSNYEPDNIRLIARDGTTVSLPATVGPSDRRHIVLTNLAALSTTSLAGKDVGLTDEDGDGYKDDLKKGAYFQIAFDLKKKAGVRCLQLMRCLACNLLLIYYMIMYVQENVYGQTCILSITIPYVCISMG